MEIENTLEGWRWFVGSFTVGILAAFVWEWVWCDLLGVM